MKHLCKNLILVVVSYSLVLSAPVSAKTVSANRAAAVKSYVNGSGSKSFLGLAQKFEKELPPAFYDAIMKKAKGANGKLWFQAVKIADNYSYFRFENSKLFVRTAVEKGKTVFYANGLKIHQDDFRNLKVVENRLFVALMAGMPSKKTSFLDLFEFKKSFAGTEIVDGKGADVPVAPVAQQNSSCAALESEIATLQNQQQAAAAQNNPALAQQKANTVVQMKNSELYKSCNIPVVAVENAQGVQRSKWDTWGLAAIAAGVVLFMLLSASSSKDKNKNKDKDKNKEKPEPTDGVGRGDSPKGGGKKGHVNCGGDNAQCGDDDAGDPIVPPGSEEYNYYDVNEDSNGSGRGADDVPNPVLKSRKKK